MTHVLGNKDKKKEEIRLSRHNYSQYSNKNKKNDENKVDETVDVTEEAAAQEVEVTPEVVDTPVVEPVEETVETVALPKTVTGVVVNCAKLNMRAKPNANAAVICVLNAASEIEINIEESTDEWFRVYTATGVDGYCMRKFVEAHL